MTKLEHAERLMEMGFHVFPLVANSKTPAIVGFPQFAAKTKEDVYRYWFDIVMDQSRPENIGISTSSFTLAGRETHLVAIDVDNKDGKQGSEELKKLALIHGPLPETFVQTTPTGGLHFVFHTPRLLRQSVSKLAPGLDIRAKGGYLVGAGSTVPKGEYKCSPLPVAEAPEWLCDLIESLSPEIETRDVVASPVDINQDGALARAKAYLERAPVAIEGEGGDATTFAVCAKVKDFGLTLQNALDVLLDNWNPKCEPPWDPQDLERKLQNAYRYGNAPVGVAAPEKQFKPSEIDPDELVEGAIQEHWLELMNQHFGILFSGSEHSVVQRKLDTDGVPFWEFLSERSFFRMFSNKKLAPNSKATLGTHWIDWDKRKEYHGLGFWPSGDAPPDALNLWTGFAKKPISRAQASSEAIRGVDAWLSHLHEGICGNEKAHAPWVLSWLAHLIQNPGEKPLTALILRGKKGTGKNAFLERLFPIIGRRRGMTLSNPRHLLGNFNAHMSNCLMLILDEAFWSGQKSADSILKSLITDPKIVIEQKGKDAFVMNNLIRLCIVGNEDWLVPASADERRYAVFDVTDWKRVDTHFFHQMRMDLDHRGGAELLMDHLLSVKLEDINVVPATKALSSQKEMSFDIIDGWIFASLEEGYFIGAPGEHQWPGEMMTGVFSTALSHYIRERNMRWAHVPPAHVIGKRLRDYGVKKVRRRSDIGREYRYELPPLEAFRFNFAQKNKIEVNWDEDIKE